MSKRPKGEWRTAEVEEAQLKKRKTTHKEAGKEISRLVAAEGDVGAGGPGPRASGCGLADPATEGAAEAPLDPDQGAGEHEQPQPNKPKATKPAPVLPWMRVPIAIEASEGILLEEVHGLDPRLKVTLEGQGIEVLFPVQTVMWHETAGGSSAAHDVCICAPTGSGKTLAYALPMLQALAGRAVPRLRALIVLPTRDLAGQVYSVLAGLCPALGLTACLAAGRVSLVAEAQALSSGSMDVVVATPGRLIAHLEGTPGFTLRHLRFLVVDETDRLLRQSYQDWLPKVTAALERLNTQAPAELAGGCTGARSSSPPAAAAAAALPGGGAALGRWGAAISGSGEPGRVVKFVVSATLTRDPSKIDRLGLHCPRYIAMSAVDHRHKLPGSLREFKLVVPAEHKPLALAALLRQLGSQPTIVFTSSVEATHRLHLMLAACEGLPGRPVEFSSLLRPEERRASLEAFTAGEAQVLVCSDAMTRGMDVAGVAVVINYDTPVYVKTYVHRAGRTARAGATGSVYTLLRHEDVRHFKDMLRKADNTYVRDVRLERGQLEEVRPVVEAALEAMQSAMAAEAPAVPGAAPTPVAAGPEAATAVPGLPSRAAGKAAAVGVGARSAAAKKAGRKRRLAGVQELLL